jgi:serine/threonine protein kinase
MNEMMSWVLALRGLTFQSSKVSMANFKILSVLGRGYYGKVMLCQEQETKNYFAIKSVRKSRLLEANKVHTIISERNILTKLDHPFIVSLKFAFQTPSKFYFVLDYAPGGELFYHLQRRGIFPIDQVRLYAAEIALALHHLHQSGIIYRDLKPENILLDRDGHIKLTDFGLSKDLTVGASETSTFCGTTEYLAPEIIKHQPYGSAVDWWMLGILVFELLFGSTPFVHSNRVTMFKNICNKEVVFPVASDPNAADLISRLLCKNPKQRAEFPEIQSHAFFRAIPFDQVLKRSFPPTFVPDIRNQEIPANFDQEFTREAALDSFVMPVFGSLTQVSEFSFAREEGLMAMDENGLPAAGEDVPPNPVPEHDIQNSIPS